MVEDRSSRDARLATEVDPDVGIEQIADVYAQAFLGAAEAAGQTESLVEELDSLAADVLEPFPAFAAVLASAQVSHEEKVGILDRVLGGQASPLLLNFLKVLSRHGRLDSLAAIGRHVRQHYERMRGRVHVRLATAQPISDDLAQRIAERLRSIIHGEPVLERMVDPNLIAGAVMRVGDTIYDASIATQLENVREQMIDRSVHEIQSRRDRFRNPAGD